MQDRLYLKQSITNNSTMLGQKHYKNQSLMCTPLPTDTTRLPDTARAPCISLHTYDFTPPSPTTPSPFHFTISPLHHAFPIPLDPLLLSLHPGSPPIDPRIPSNSAD